MSQPLTIFLLAKPKWFEGGCPAHHFWNFPIWTSNFIWVQVRRQEELKLMWGHSFEPQEAAWSIAHGFTVSNPKETPIVSGFVRSKQIVSGCNASNPVGSIIGAQSYILTLSVSPYRANHLNPRSVNFGPRKIDWPAENWKFQHENFIFMSWGCEKWTPGAFLHRTWVCDFLFWEFLEVSENFKRSLVN